MYERDKFIRRSREELGGSETREEGRTVIYGTKP